VLSFLRLLSAWHCWHFTAVLRAAAPLLLVAARPPPPLSVDISRPHGTQQQTRRT